ncbi:MAG: alanine--tRNA ligase, partial [Hyphomicrobiaceae bacterium]|nr:alanine--tRNA ligase [Hyphomicrobiaceae bacterium]
VQQKGSLVAPDRLRFDFAHFTRVGDRALADIESLVNRKVLEDIPVETEQMPIEEALRSGAMALFGEKYGERVRVVGIGDFSRELCGGTHCARSGEVGLVKLTQERGIASGTRRVEAVSGEGSLDRFRREHAIVRSLEEQFSVSGDKVLDEIGRRLEELRTAQRDLEGQRVATVRQRVSQKAEDPQVVAGVRLVVERVDGLEPQEMRAVADGLRQKLGSGVVVLGRADGSKVSLLVAVTRDLTERLKAGDLVRRLGPIIGGGGGGRPEFIQCGGSDPQGIQAVIEGLKDIVK